jgi:hypothetical protein
MIQDQTLPEFKRHAVQPVECLKRGWELIKDQYWLFLGMSVVGLLIGNAVPLGILAGPMMCGIYLGLLKRQAGEPVEFAVLFKGFDFFVDGMIAGILHAVPVILIIVPFYILIFFGQFAMMAASQNGEPNPAAAVGYLAVLGIGLPIMMILLIIISVGFAFAFPLIADRRLSGVNAVKLSFKAAMANFWSLFGLLLLNGLLSLVGVCFCIVGVYFVLPVTFAALAVAYTQVFGSAPRSALYTPPPPPSFT